MIRVSFSFPVAKCLISLLDFFQRCLYYLEMAVTKASAVLSIVVSCSMGTVAYIHYGSASAINEE